MAITGLGEHLIWFPNTHSSCWVLLRRDLFVEKNYIGENVTCHFFWKIAISYSYTEDTANQDMISMLVALFNVTESYSNSNFSNTEVNRRICNIYAYCYTCANAEGSLTRNKGQWWIPGSRGRSWSLQFWQEWILWMIEIFMTDRQRNTYIHQGMNHRDLSQRWFV